MISALVGAAVLLNPAGAGALNVRVIEAPNIIQMIYRQDDGFCAYFNENGEVVLLDDVGAVEKKIEIPKGEIALYYERKTDQIITTNEPLVRTPDLWYADRNTSLQLRALRDQLFVISKQLIFLGEEATLTLPHLSRNLGLGINHSKNRIAYIYDNYSRLPMMDIYDLTTHVWIKRIDTVTPEVYDIGLCIVSSGYNDLVFLDDDHVAYIGAMPLVEDQNALTPWVEGMTDLTHLPLSPPSFGNSTAMLCVTDIRRGDTTAHAVLRVFSRSKLGGMSFNNMTSTSDGKTLLIKAVDNILAISTDELLKLHKEYYEPGGKASN